MTTDYDSKLRKLEWFKLHPQLLPFIGDNYNDYKILQIGESHYIGRKNDNDKFDIRYFKDNWWSTHCDDLVSEYGEWFNTRNVLKSYLIGKKRRAYSIFGNVVKSFDNVVHNEKELKERELYSNFAFMNFFQMPSLYRGEKYWKSLVRSANYVLKNDKKQADDLAREIFRKCTEVSIKTVDDVIDIIEPEVVIITSMSVGNAYAGREYEECKGKYYKDDKLIYTSHPCTAYWEHKNLKVGKTGKQILEEKLRKYIEISK